jgi:hypothetical protein
MSAKIFIGICGLIIATPLIHALIMYSIFIGGTYFIPMIEPLFHNNKKSLLP